jgi:hypothetical protein
MAVLMFTLTVWAPLSYIYSATEGSEKSDLLGPSKKLGSVGLLFRWRTSVQLFLKNEVHRAFSQLCIQWTPRSLLSKPAQPACAECWGRDRNNNHSWAHPLQCTRHYASRRPGLPSPHHWSNKHGWVSCLECSLNRNQIVWLGGFTFWSTKVLGTA